LQQQLEQESELSSNSKEKQILKEIEEFVNKMQLTSDEVIMR
jgi:hypothetical protein